VCECGFTYRRRGVDVSEDATYRVDRVEAYGPLWDENLRELWVDSLLTLEDISLRLCGSRRADQRIKIEAERLKLPFPRRYKNRRAANTYKKRNVTLAKQRSVKSKQSSQDVLREKQQQWLDILKKNPNTLRTELKEKFPTLYKWLNKRARKWLYKHLPPRKDHSFDWAGLDDSLAPAVTISAARIKCAERPRRVTLFAIGKDIGCYDYLRKRIGRLPRTAKVLKGVLEASVDFMERKIHLAVLAINERGEIPTRVKLLKEAKVSRGFWHNPNVQAAIESAIYYMSEGRSTALAA